IADASFDWDGLGLAPAENITRATRRPRTGRSGTASSAAILTGRRTLRSWRIRRTITQRRIGNFQHIIPVRDDDRDVRCHPRFEFEIGIIHADDRVVSDYVLNRDRGVTHLHDLAVKGAVRERINA